MAQKCMVVAAGAHHAAVLAWSQLRPDRVEPERLEILKGLKERTGSRRIYRLVGVGPGGSNVIAKQSGRDHALREHTVYEHVLSHLAVPVPRYYGCVMTGSDETCWVFVEDVGNERYSVDLEEHRRAAGRWLGVLHTTAAGLVAEGPLPVHGPSHYLANLRHASKRLRKHIADPALRTDHRAQLSMLLERCDELQLRWHRVDECCDRMPRTLVHGDFSRKNIHVRLLRSSETVMPFDWGEAGWSVPCIDLARSPSPKRGFAAHVDLDAYWAVVREHWPDVDLSSVQRWARLGTLFRLILVVRWELSSMVAALDRYRNLVSFYQDHFSRALEAPELA
jgi:aminoglycoside phosphotransferase (APT) family kinase protein